MKQLPFSKQEIESIPEVLPKHSPSNVSNGNGSYGYAGYGYGDMPERAEGGTLLEYWRILRRRKGTLMLVPLLGVLAAILVTLPQTPVYQARGALEIQNINNDFLNSKQLNPVTE